MERTEPDHERLVQPEGLDHPEAVRIVVDQGGSVGDDGVVHGVPVTPELDGHLVHAPGVASDLFGDPPAGPVAHGHAGRPDT